MAKKNPTQEDLELLEKITAQPLFKERLQQILSIAENSCEGCRTADQAESKLTDEIRLLSNEVLHGWVRASQQQLDKDLKAKDPHLKIREKKTNVA